jgi:hypothetical protein
MGRIQCVCRYALKRDSYLNTEIPTLVLVAQKALSHWTATLDDTFFPCHKPLPTPPCIHPIINHTTSHHCCIYHRKASTVMIFIEIDIINKVDRSAFKSVVRVT